ncbi:MAG: GNAT family N-acetyltransferase [Prevotella sp.]|nr:GNAT family N-acetyltransferase [Prevotella sp.]
MFEIIRYTPEHADEWNRFVAESKNGTFLFNRNYMDYHSDRFEDHSLMFYYDGKLYAIMPANQTGTTFQSHAGLTYGGLVMNSKTTAAMTVTLFQEFNRYLKEQGFKQVLYKCVPWIYHKMAAEEDLYAIARTCDARLVDRDLGSVIFQRNTIRWERVRRRALKRAQEAGITVERSNDYAGFWQVLNDNLKLKYNSKPVHTLAEIELLHSRFPENIVLYIAKKSDEILAGIVIYVSSQVARAQYSSATPEGKQLGAIDIIYDRIINNDYRHLPYFEFGTSALGNTNIINESLVFQKEGFGGRGVCFDRYEWSPTLSFSEEVLND